MKEAFWNTPLFARVSAEELVFFTKHFSTLIQASIPLGQTLEVLVEQAPSAHFKHVVRDISHDVQNGQSLSSALKRHPRVFSQLYCQLIESSEQSGTLDENLKYLALQLEKSLALKKKIQSALMYPTLVLLATVTMGGFIALFILPQLVTFFQSFQSDLPLSTRILLGFAQLMRQSGPLIALALAAVFFLIRALLQTRWVQPYWHRWILHAPLLGKLLHSIQLSQFARNLSLLLHSGVPIVPSVEITAATLSNIALRQQLLAVRDGLLHGKNIGESLQQLSHHHFPLLVTRMITVGETTGKLDETLLYLAEFYEQDIENTSKDLSTLLEPILLLGIGLLVGFVALAIISPIYELTGSLRR